MIGVAVATSSGLAAQGALAQSAGAVGRIEAFGGQAADGRPLGGKEDGSSAGLLPSISFPAGPARLQLDGIAAEHLDDTIVGAAAQLTVQRGGNWAVGAYGSYVQHRFAGDLRVSRIGPQVNYLGERVTVSLVGGYEDVEQAVVAAGAVPGFTVADAYGRDGAFSMADVVYYPSESWSVQFGHRYVGGRHAGVLGFERQFGRLSLFGEGRFGDEDYAGGWLGVRMRFGEGSGSLRDRDRAGPLPNRLKDDLFGVSNTRRRTRTAIPVVVPPPPPPPPPTGPTCSCGPCYAA
jgi:hypothetical protein